MNTSDKYKCKFCPKEYKLKFNFDRHIDYCQFVNKSKKEQLNDLDLCENIPTLKTIFGYVKELSVRINKLEQENIALKEIIQKEKKKINVIDWLNTKSNIKPRLTFTDWILAFPINNHLQSVFNSDLMFGIIQTLEVGVDELHIKNTELIPIQAFAHKPNAFYIYDYENKASDEIKWILLSNQLMDKWLNCIAHRFLIEFQKWCDIHEVEIQNNEKMKDTYVNYYQKVLGGTKMNDDTRNLRIRQNIYNSLKQNAKTIVEYEIV